MNFDRIKNIKQSKYFKPVLKSIILIWFLYAVYDIFFKNSSDYPSSGDTYIVSNNTVNNVDSNKVINKPSNSTSPKTVNSNSNKNGENTFYSYTVSKGDNLGSIAARFKTSKDRLKQINSLKSEQLKVGTEIKVPVKSIHIVKKGETLYSIAVKYGTTRKILMEANKLSSETSIKVGQSICIPLL